MKYIPSSALREELVKGGLEQFCEGIEIDVAELAEVFDQLNHHPMHIHEPWARIENRAAMFIIFRDHHVPEAAQGKQSAIDAVTAKRVVVVHETLRELVREKFPLIVKAFDSQRESHDAALEAIKEESADNAKAIAEALGGMSEAILNNSLENHRFFEAKIEQLSKKATKAFKWLAGLGLSLLIALLVVILLLATGHAQGGGSAPSASGKGISVIRFQEAGVDKATKAGPFTINFSSGCSVTPAAATIGVACSGGSGGSPGGSGTELQYRGGASTFSAVTGSSVSSGKVTFGDSIFLPDGTAALPSYSFTNATDSGFYHAGSGIWGFSRAGTSSFLFSSGGVILMPSSGVLSFTLGSTSNSQDTGVSRCAALVVCFGNATSADFSGTGKATIFNAVTGFRINNAATSGRFLKGDGTNFVVSSGSASGVGTPTDCNSTNKFVTSFTLSSDAAPTSTCTTATLASAQFANQGTTTTVLHGNGAGNPSFGAVVESDITLADNTTNNVSISNHGFTPKLPNDATKYLDGTGAYTVPAGGTSYTFRDGLTTTSTTIDFNPGDPSIAYIYDEFASGTNATGMIGSLGWALNNITGAPTAAPQAGVYPNIGIVRLSTSGSASTTSSITTGTGTSGPPFGDLATTATNWEMNIIFRLNNGITGNNRVRIGFFNTGPAVVPTDGAYFRFDQNAAGANDTTFHLCARRASGTETCSSSTLAADAAFHRLKIRSTAAGTWLMSLWSASGASEIAEITLATGAGGTGINLAPPTVNQQAGFLLGNDTTVSAITVDADFFSFKIRGLSR